MGEVSWRIAKALKLAVAILVMLSCSCTTAEQTGENQTEPDVQAASEEHYTALREAMVEQLIERGYLHDEKVAEAMRQTKRHLFVPERYRPWAYYDTPLSIGEEQTISAPGVVALMTEVLELDPEKEQKVLEIGTGSGYQAAVLSPLAKHVYTIEILEGLAESAAERLEELEYENITVKCGDGYKGWKEHAPFDGIIVTCAPEEIPRPLIEQLAEGGRMVIPVGPEAGIQELYLLIKEAGEVTKKAIIPVRFVPMTGEAQEQE